MKFLESNITNTNQLNVVFMCKHCGGRYEVKNYKGSCSPVICPKCEDVDKEVTLLTTQACRSEQEYGKIKYRCWMDRTDPITWELITPTMCKHYEKWDGLDETAPPYCTWKKSGWCTNKQAVLAAKNAITEAIKLDLKK